MYSTGGRGQVMGKKQTESDSSRCAPTAGNCFTCQARDPTEWCTLEDEDLTLLNSAKTHNVYKAGQVIFYQGNPCLGLYCVESGEVALRKTDEAGHAAIVRLLHGGQTLEQRAPPSLRALRSRREVARFPSAGVTESHRHDRDLLLVVERVLGDSHPLPQAITARIVERHAGRMHAATGSLTRNEQASTGMSPDDRAYSVFQVLFTKAAGPYVA